ncbi:MAG TPA: histidinol-phosphate transaminase [Gemmatimonadaceae bacterium]|nr:histidinol-phosphate transaminase [Gemmatimonadaceae bacterium]
MPNASFVPRAALSAIVPVVADSPPAPLHLADNTNLFGVPPAALRELSALDPADLVHYPSSSGPELREAIAGYLDVSPNEIVLGCGADDVINCAFRAFCEPGEGIAYPDPTFMMARYFAITNNLRPLPVPYAGGALDTDGLLAARAAMLYVCAPNNPTGSQPHPAELHLLLERFGGPVIIDEAYAEFSGESIVNLVAEQPRLIVVRTFSKAFGLAGLRVGYAVASPALVREIEKTRGPFAVSTAALRAARAAVTEDVDWVHARVRDAIEARTELVRLLTERGFAPVPSRANFVLVPVANARRTAERLAASGIAVRILVALPGIGDAVRITVAPIPLMRQVADALRDAA